MLDSCETEVPTALAFGPFRLIPSQRLLLDGDTVCRLGCRALSILVTLVERTGMTVSKQELMAAVWPDTFVEETNLRVHVAALRKALGDGVDGSRYIVNVTGRGYCFAAPVRRIEAAAPEAPAAPPAGCLHNMPLTLTRVVGRAQAIEAVMSLVPTHRCVTIAGPGGIGKTTVAVAVAERLLPIFHDGVWFIDLATIADPSLIPLVVASALRVSVQSDSPLTSLIAFLRFKRLLLVLDNCEHVVDAVAALVEQLLGGAADVAVLATSRETLRAAGEWVYRLGPIALPPEDAALSAAEALEFPAVQLFVECAAANLEAFRLEDADVPAVTEICRQLDGVPLAIELAAVRVDLFGLRGLANALEDRFLLHSVGGRRTAMPRQQSLTHALDWSYRLLSPAEQTVLRRLSVFRTGFTLEGAVAVAAEDGIDATQVYAAVITLTTKSLLSTDISGNSPRHQHRLLHITRVFVGHLLEESGESGTILRRHARFLCGQLQQAEADWQTMERQTWLRHYAGYVDDVRATLDWAFSPSGDVAIGVELTAAAMPLGFELSLIDEFRMWAERAVMHAARLASPLLLPEMRLNIAWGKLGYGSITFTQGAKAGFDRAEELSLKFDSPELQAEPLIAKSGPLATYGCYAEAAAMAARASEIVRASGDPMAILAADRAVAQAAHLNGEHATARVMARRVLEHPARRVPLHYMLPVAPRVSMRVILARVAWIEGFPDQARSLAQDSVAAAEPETAIARCYALGFAAIPIAIWRGDTAAADAMVARVAELSTRYRLAYWQAWARSFAALLRRQDGEADVAIPLAGTMVTDTFATFSADLLTPPAMLRAERGEAGWCNPELCRAAGEWILAQRAPGAAQAAEALFEKARSQARAQGALSWELRAVTSLARLWQGSGRASAARELLLATLQRFTEGHATADLRAAAALVDALGASTGSALRVLGSGEFAPGLDWRRGFGGEQHRPAWLAAGHIRKVSVEKTERAFA